MILWEKYSSSHSIFSNDSPVVWKYTTVLIINSWSTFRQKIEKAMRAHPVRLNSVRLRIQQVIKHNETLLIECQGDKLHIKNAVLLQKGELCWYKTISHTIPVKEGVSISCSGSCNGFLEFFQFATFQLFISWGVEIPLGMQTFNLRFSSLYVSLGTRTFTITLMNTSTNNQISICHFNIWTCLAFASKRHKPPRYKRKFVSVGYNFVSDGYSFVAYARQQGKLKSEREKWHCGFLTSSPHYSVLQHWALESRGWGEGGSWKLPWS